MVTAAELVTAAKAGIENLPPSEFAEEARRAHAVLVDVREPNETEQGVISGALLAPRGMLEFYADPSSPHHLEEFRPDRRILLYCAAGSRSALAVQTLQTLGYTDVAHLDGGMKGWKEASLPVETNGGSHRDG